MTGLGGQPCIRGEFFIVCKLYPQPRQLQWSFMVPLIGGRYHIITQLARTISGIEVVYTANWGIIWYRSHLLREPETTIDNWADAKGRNLAVVIIYLINTTHRSPCPVLFFICSKKKKSLRDLKL